MASPARLAGMTSNRHKHSKEDAGYDYEGSGLSYQPTFGSELTLNTTRSGQPPSPVLHAKSSRELGQPFKFPSEEFQVKPEAPIREQASIVEPEPKQPTPPNEVADSEPEAVVDEETDASSRIPERNEENNQEDPTPLLPIDRDKYDDLLLDIENVGQPIGPSLRKTESSYSLSKLPGERFTAPRWPRHLSFSAVEDALLTWDDVGGRAPAQNSEETEPALAIKRHRAAAVNARYIAEKISDLEQMVRVWVENKVKEIDEL